MPEAAVMEMTARLQAELGGSRTTILLYGSAALGDFRPGWSDIDILVLTERPIAPKTAARLVGLRQRMTAEPAMPRTVPDRAVFRAFEGGMLSLEGFLAGALEPAVYWGTRGERIRAGYGLDPFETLCLLERGRVLAGEDVRARIAPPTREQLREAAARHLAGIRANAEIGGLYACGWLLDIARGLYTLETGGIIAKTAAGEWALARGLVPDEKAMRRALALRREPRLYEQDPAARAFCAGLGPGILRFAEVLEQAIARDRAG